MEFYLLKLCDSINSSLKLPSAGHSVAATTKVANTDGSHIMNGYLCSLSPLPSLGPFLSFGLYHFLVCVIYNPGFNSQHVALTVFGCPLSSGVSQAGLFTGLRSVTLDWILAGPSSCLSGLIPYLTHLQV